MIGTTGTTCCTLLRAIALAAVTSACWFMCACGAGQHRSNSAAPSLTSLSVTPSLADLALGRSVQLSVTGTYSDQTSKDLTHSAIWSTSDLKIANVDSSGLATSIGVGHAVLTATIDRMSARASLTVADAALTSILVSPPTSSVALGQSVQLTATGTYSDKSTQDVTGLVTWSTSQPAVAIITSSGMANSKAIGSAIITATLRAFSGANQLVVSPAALVGLAVTSDHLIVAAGTTTQFTARGTFTDGSTQDLSSTVAWTSSSLPIVTVSPSGLATGKAPGTSTISATQGVLHGTAAMTVSSATILSLSVTAGTASIPLGLAAQFAAKGKFTDGSTQDLTNSVNWASSPAGIVSISASGLASSHAVGAATVTASSGSTRGTAPLNVSAAVLMGVDVRATNSSFPLGTTQQLIATGRLTDGTLRDITNTAAWSTSSGQVVSITNNGFAAAVAQGTATISAAAPGASSTTVTGKTVLAVSAPQLTAISISPDKPVVPTGSRQPLAATGTFTDGSKQDLTQTGAWSSANPQVANISPSGIAIAQRAGTSTITSSFQGVVGSTLLTVQPSAAVNHFSVPATGADSTVRITNPGVTGLHLCAMIYVFDNDQQLTECCGCQVSPDGLKTLSLNKDLLSNPLTGVKSANGSIFVIPAEFASNTNCDPSAVTPSGVVVAWATHLQNVSNGQTAVTEDTFSATPLPSTETAAIRAECYFVQQLGSGHGICSCGTGDAGASLKR